MSDYIIDPSNQQGQPQNRRGAVGSPMHTTTDRLIPADALHEGPEEITDLRETLDEGDNVLPMPDHPGKMKGVAGLGTAAILDHLGRPVVKPTLVPDADIADGTPMGVKIGKTDRLIDEDSDD